MGFGREIRDFISAMQAGEKIAGSSDDRAYKKLRNEALKQKMGLDKQKTDAQIKRLGRGTQIRPLRPLHPLQEEGLRLRNQQLRQSLEPAAPTGPASTVAPMDSPSGMGKRSAIDLEPEYQTSELAPEEELEPTTFARKGGAITLRGYADGGAVEENDPLADDDGDVVEPDDDEDDGANSGNDGASPSSYSHLAAHDATQAGLAYAKAESEKEDASIPPKAIPAAGRSNLMSPTRRYLTGQGASSPDEVLAVGKAIDPEGKMSEAERNMASLSHVYSYYIKKGDPQAADRAAASLVQAYRQISNRYEALMKVAAENGDVDGVMKAAVRSHANIPDGKDLKLEKTKGGKINWEIVNSETGKKLEGGLATPEEILQWASKGTLNSFDQLVEASSKDRAEAAKTKKGKKDGATGVKASDSKIMDAQINDEFDAIPEPVRKDLDAGGIKGTAYQIRATNGSLSPSDAMLATLEMTQVDPANPDTRKFKTIGPVEGGVKFELSNGQPIVIPDELLPRIKKMRDMNAASAREKKAKNEAAAKRTDENINAAIKVITPPVARPNRAASAINDARRLRPMGAP